MQTFLPYASLKKSAQALDFRRLGKQRVEARQILDILVNNKTGGWSHHPAVKMWRGHEQTLAAYYNCCIQEWIRRGYENNMVRWYIAPATKLVYPDWFGGRIHSSHRAALLYKAAVYWDTYKDGPSRSMIAARTELEWYDQFGWTEFPNRDEVAEGGSFRHYHWPV